MPNWCRQPESELMQVLTKWINSKKSTTFFKITKTHLIISLPVPDFKNIPNEKGELPKLEQMKNPKGEVMWETYNFPDGKNDDRWYHWNIAKTGEPSGNYQTSTLNMLMTKFWNLDSPLLGVHLEGIM